MRVRQICGDDWREWRLIRLRALTEAPEAFGSRLADVDDREEAWRDRIEAAGACFLATQGDTVIGMVAADPVGDGLGLQSMFVAEESRRHGAGRALIDAVVKHAAGRALRLTVVADNPAARIAYERSGFRHDGADADDQGCVTMHYAPRPEENPMPVDPTGADLKRYLAEDPGGPVVMLNLLKFVDGGRDGYTQYAAAFAPFVAAVGGRIVHVGDLATELVRRDDFDWDVVLLVEYPTRAAFSQMVADPEYQQVTHLRTESVSEAVLQASTPW